jgi:predicted transcriptional regulator
MAKMRTTVTLDEEVLRAVRIKAARSGRGDSAVIEEALRRDLGLDFLEQLWARNSLTEPEANALALEAQHATRRTSRSSRTSKST